MYIPKRKRDIFTVTLKEGAKNAIGWHISSKEIRNGPMTYTGAERADNRRHGLIRADDCFGTKRLFDMKLFEFHQMRTKTPSVIIPKSACPGC